MTPAPRRSSGRSPGGRAGGSSGKRSTREPRGQGAQDRGRGESNRDARRSARQEKARLGLILGGSGAAVFLVVLLCALMSGGEERPRRRERRLPVASRPAVTVIDWYSEGRSKGFHWKDVMKNRRQPFTREEVEATADRMTSNYVTKGIAKEGEEQFKRGFCEAVLGRQ